MSTPVFAELKFWLMVAASLGLPFGIYGVLMARQAISRRTVLLLGFALIAVAGLDVVLLQKLAAAAYGTPSLADDKWFGSEITLALYLLPAMFGGIGINVVSHILVSHLVEAERRYRELHPRA